MSFIILTVSAIVHNYYWNLDLYFLGLFQIISISYRDTFIVIEIQNGGKNAFIRSALIHTHTHTHARTHTHTHTHTHSHTHTHTHRLRHMRAHTHTFVYCCTTKHLT